MAGGRHGGIAAACRFLTEHGGAVEADLARFYGEHLGDFPWPLTPRRLGVFLENLPEDSAVRLAVTPEANRGWDRTHGALFDLIDEIRADGWLTRRSLGVKAEAFPERYQRPWEVAQEPAVDTAGVARVLAHHGIPARSVT